MNSDSSRAAGMDHKVIVKLHPVESRRVRQALVERVLSAEHRRLIHRRLIEIRGGPMTPDLFARAWCGLAVESSAAVESRINGVPCFLCSWFDPSAYEYGKYAKFPARVPIDAPQRIREIPQLLQRFEITAGVRERPETAISPEQLDSVLSGS
ncbi:MAG: hypothetical protein WCB11_30485 [Terriglobales bacterium]|jgi:hypothetical protein